jgi:receptor protein-tyrosine kinase
MRVCASPRLTAIEGGALSAPRADRRLGHILAEHGRLDADSIERVLVRQQSHQVRFGEAALQLGLISVDDLAHAIKAQFELPHLLPSDHRFSLELVTAFEPCHACAEQIRTVRSQLVQRCPPGVDSPLKVAIISPGRGDGRSYIAANLAVAFAQLGRRTLLIDADMRRPRQHRIFNVSDRVGLSTVLGGRADRSAVVPLPALGPLYLLCAGGCPPNPLDLLARDAWPALLRSVRRDFDVILVDTPPVEDGADAMSAAHPVGNALLVVRRNTTSLLGTAALVNQMRVDGTCLLGSVLNDA